MESIFSIEYTPEKRDYVRAARIISRKSPGFIALAAMVAFIMLASGVALIFPGLAGETLRGLAPFLLAAGLTYLLYVGFLVPRQLNKAYESESHLRLTRRLNFFESYLMMTIGDQSVNLPWENLTRTFNSGNDFILVFQDDEQVIVFIPGRALESQAALENLQKFIH